MIHIQKLRIVAIDLDSGAKVLKKDFEFDCSHINLLVGDQGCGKSTLLRMLQKNSKGLQLTLADHVLKCGVSSYYFDSEKDNPRVKDPEMYTTPSGEDIGIGVGGAIGSRFRSHGEIMQSMILTPISKAKDCVVILDEPESGLSITNQFKLIKVINAAVKRGCQFFIATHCYPLIEANNVVSLEHWDVMTGGEFIKKVSSK